MARPAGFHQNIIFRTKPQLNEQLDASQTRIHLFTELNLDAYASEGMMDIAVGNRRFEAADVSSTVPTRDDIAFIKLFAQDDELYEYRLHRFGPSAIFDSANARTIARKGLVKDERGRKFLLETLDYDFLDSAAYPVVWDYENISGTWDPDDGVWHADATYYVSDDLEIDSGQLQIEPGTFVKFNTGKKLFTSGSGKIIARGEPYKRIYFVSKNDNANGEIISGSSGSPASGDWVGLEAGAESELEFCHIVHAQKGLVIKGDLGIPFRHSWIAACSDCNLEVTNDPNITSVTVFNNILNAAANAGIRVTGSGGNVAIINNSLQNTGSAVYIAANCTRQITVENNIFSSCATAGIYMDPADPNYLYNNFNGYYGNGTNTDVVAGPNSIALTAHPFYSDAIGISFVYLNDDAEGGALCIDAGNGSVESAGYSDPNLWSSTYPVNLYTTTTAINNDAVWQPDYDSCDSGMVDLGYHHSRIDYVIYNADITVSGCTLTVRPGTVIAHHVDKTTGAGKLTISSDGTLVCNGEPFGKGCIEWVEMGRAAQKWKVDLTPYTHQKRFVECLGEGEVTFSRFVGMGFALAPDGEDCTVRDCIFELNTRAVDYYNTSSFSCENCLFNNNLRGVFLTSSSGAIRNCTFNRSVHFGVVSVGSGSVFDVKNSLFHSTAAGSTSTIFAAISDYSQAATITESYNAFYNNKADLLEFETVQDLDATDWTDDAGAAYAQIISGNPFSLAWTSFTDQVRLDQYGDAVDNGYDPNSAGMRGYTTALDDSIDDPNMDIGFHYPVPIDSDGDQLWDYEEYWLGTDPDNPDTDGDGLTDFEEVMIYGTDPLLADTDGDGMPDGWEVQYANMNPLIDDANSDLDGDGVIALDEYRYGLDPDVNNEGDYFTMYEYDSSGQVIMQRTVEVMEGRVYASQTNTEYDVLGRVIETRQLANPGVGPGTGESHTEDMVTVNIYDIAGNLKKTAVRMTSESDPNVIDPNDIMTENFYDSLGRITKVADAEGYETTYTYNGGGQLETVTDPNGAVTTNYYDESGRLEKVVDALGHYRTMDYDSLGRVIRAINWQEDGETDTPLMQQRTVYDDAGHAVLQAMLADAGSAAGYVVDPNVDMVTEYVYDDTMGTYPGMLVSTTIYYAYDSTSGTSQTATTVYDYDLLGRRYKTTDPDGNETIMSYDTSGRVERGQQKDFHPLIGGTDLVMTMDYEFDNSGRLIKQTAKPSTDPNYSGDWQVTEYRNALSYRIEEKKPNGIVTSHTFNTFGQKVRTVADDDYSGHTGLKQTTEWGFDRAGRQVSIAGYTGVGTGGTKQTTTYTYDKLGNVTLITYPDTKTIEYVYGDQGKVRERTDQRGLVTYYKYDRRRNLTEKEVTVDSVTTQESFTYDGLGRILTAAKTVDSSSVSLIEYAYNDLGKVTEFDQTLFGGTERQMAYTYDQFGFLKSTTYPDGSTVIGRTNDWRGRIATLTRGQDELVAYDYIGARVAKRSYAVPSVAGEFEYDNLGRVTGIDYGESVVKFGYTYVDYENNIYRKTFDHRSGDPYNEYTYDDLDRLTDAEYLVDGGTPDREDSFVMDGLGNRTGSQTLSDDTVSFTVESLTNRYTSIGGHSISHDDAGNLTVDKDGYKYSYDYENRVVKIQKPDGLGGWDDVAEMAYDALGRRIRVIDSIASTTALYYYNPDWQCLAEYSGAGALQRYFIYGNYIDEALVMNDGTDDFYYVQDHLYSTVALIAYVDPAWTTVERYEYDAYGTVLVYTDDGNDDTWFTGDDTTASASAKGNPYTFTGRRLDVLDGGALLRIHYRHRDYDTYAGRFAEHDPTGINPHGGPFNTFEIHAQFVEGANLYQYVKSHVVAKTDAYGLESIQLMGITLRRNHVKPFAIIGLKESDGYGHWWSELGATESYGWWPKYPVDVVGTIFGVEGELNGVTSFHGTATQDPHQLEGDMGEEAFHPWRAQVSLTVRNLKHGSSKGKRCCAATEAEIKACARAFAVHFATTHSKWSHPFGPDCHTFQIDMMNACCMKKNRDEGLAIIWN